MTKGAISLMRNSITQDMAYRQSLMKYAEKNRAIPAARRACSGLWEKWDCSRIKSRKTRTSPSLMSKWPIPENGYRWMWKSFQGAVSPTRSCGCSNTPSLTSSRSSPSIPRRTFCRSWQHGMPGVGSRSNASRQTMALNLPTAFQSANGIGKRCLSGQPQNWGSATSSFILIRPGITAKWSAATGRIRNAFIPVMRSIL